MDDDDSIAMTTRFVITARNGEYEDRDWYVVAVAETLVAAEQRRDALQQRSNRADLILRKVGTQEQNANNVHFAKYGTHSKAIVLQYERDMNRIRKCMRHTEPAWDFDTTYDICEVPLV